MPMFEDQPEMTVFRPQEAPAREAPLPSEVWTSAFRMENDVVNGIDLLTSPQYRRDPNYNVAKKLKESVYWDYRDNFIGVGSDEEFNYVAGKIEQENRDRDVLARSGVMGIVAGISAGIFSPTILMPFTGNARGLAAVGRGLTMGLAGATAQELPLLLNQETRTATEVGISIGASTLLSGLLGGAVGVLRAGEREALEAQLSFDPTSKAIPSPVGAAVGTAQDADGLARGANVASRVLDSNTITRSPVTDTLTGISAQARWTTAQLADGGLSLEGNALGIPTTPGGTAENRINFWWGGYARGVSALDEQFNLYRFDNPAPIAARLRAGFADLTGQTGGKMSRDEFKREVTKAGWRNDTHENPMVAAAAAAIRKEIYDPILKEAQEIGLLGELGDIADPSYLNRIYNHEAIRADVNGFVRFLEDKFNQKYQAQFAEQLEKFELRQARTTELVEDLGRSDEEIQELRDKFGAELVDIEKLENREQFNALEDTIANLRALARQQPPTLEGETLRKQYLKDAKDMAEQRGPLFKDTKQRKQELKRRLSNLNKAAVAVETKLANKIEKIERAEELSLNTLKRATYAARKILDNIDKYSDKELDAALETLGTRFARAAEIYERGEERIAKLVQAEADRVGPFTPDEPVTPDRILAAETLQQQRFEGLRDIQERLLDAEDLGREAVRDLLNDMVDATLTRAQRIVEKRAVRTQRLREAAKGLTPEAQAAKIDDILAGSRATEAKFVDRIRGIGGEIEDLVGGKVDFRKQALTDAQLVKDKILGTYLRLPAIDIMQGERGPQLARLLDIPSEEMAKWLDTDIDKIAKVYTRTMGADIEIMRKLGTVNGEEQFTRMFEEMNEQLFAVEKMTTKKGEPAAEKTKQKEVLRIQDEYARYKTNLEGIIGRLRGNYGLPTDFDGMGFRMAQTVMHLNVLRYMGGVTISSLPDVARPVMRYGLIRTFRDGFIPLVTNLKAFKMSAREARQAGVGIDAITSQRANSLFEVLDDLGRGSKFERGVEFLSGKQGLVALFNYWTDGMKQLTGAIANARLMDSIMDVVENTNPSGKSIKFLAEVGIDGPMAQRIADQVRKNAGGGKVDGVWLPQTENWKDDIALRGFRAALAREVNNTIVTPGVERPLWTNASTTGRLLSQFKSFAFSSTYKTVLAGMQQRDANFVTGVTISLAMGALSYYTYSLATPERYKRMLEAGPDKWADEAIQRSGVLGVLGLAQDITSRIPATAKISSFSGGRSARRGGDDLIETLMGPTFDFAKTSADVITEINDPTASTAHKMRQLLPWQNVSYLSYLFDSIEKSANLKERRQ